MPIAHFAHGVASGDPHARPSVVLWTRVTPDDGEHARARAPGPTVTVALAGVDQRRRFATHRPHRRQSAPGRRATTRSRSTSPGLSPATDVLLPVRATPAQQPASAAPAPRPRRDADAGQPPSRRGLLRQPRRPAGSAPTATSPTARTCTPSCTSVTTSTSTAPASTATARATSTSVATSRPTRSGTLADYRRRHAQYKRDPDLHAPAHEVRLHRHLGRPQPGQRRLQGRRGEPHPGGGCLDLPPRRGPPGVRRVDAGADGAAPPRPATAPSSIVGCSSATSPRISMLDLRTYRDKQLGRTGRPDAGGDPDRTLAGRGAAGLAQGVPGPAVGRSGSWSATR